MLENLLFLLLGALVAELLHRSRKRHNERKEWYRRVVVEVSWIQHELPRVNPKSADWESFFDRLKTADSLLDNESLIYGSAQDRARIKRFDSDAKALRHAVRSQHELIERWSELLDGLIKYFLPKAR